MLAFIAYILENWLWRWPIETILRPRFDLFTRSRSNIQLGEIMWQASYLELI